MTNIWHLYGVNWVTNTGVTFFISAFGHDESWACVALLFPWLLCHNWLCDLQRLAIPMWLIISFVNFFFPNALNQTMGRQLGKWWVRAWGMCVANSMWNLNLALWLMTYFHANHTHRLDCMGFGNFFVSYRWIKNGD